MTRPTLIDEERIYEYCDSDVGVREHALREIGTKPDFPSAVLPVFEICRATYFGAVKKGVNPAVFHDCWQSFVTEHWQFKRHGFPVTLATNVMDPVTAPDDFIEIGMPLLPEGCDDETEDDRDRRSDHVALTTRYRELRRFAMVKWTRGNDGQHRAQCEPPDYLSALDESYICSSNDLVLDTNIFLEVINRLSLSFPQEKRLVLSDRFSSKAKDRMNQNLLSNGNAGNLIIPSNVVEEADRTARNPRKADLYGQAKKVLHAILTQPDDPLWSAFHLVPFSMDFLGAFVRMEEVLFKTTEDKEVWPDFSDAMVLAHGLYYGCPVASSEWDDAGKADWQNMDTLFPGLRI
jgi:hypothetical protein